MNFGLILWYAILIIILVLLILYFYIRFKASVIFFVDKDKFFPLPGFIIKLVCAFLFLPFLFFSYKWIFYFGMFVIFQMLFDLVVMTFFANSKKRWFHILYHIFAVPLILTAVFFILGYVNTQNITRKEYNVPSEKEVLAVSDASSTFTTYEEGSSKLVMLADLHYPKTMNEEKLKEVVDRINEEDADIIVLCGDMTDEDTSKEKMLECIRVLGELDAKLGVFFVWGNHDDNRYNSAPTYEKAEVYEAYKNNGIYVLEDEAVLFGNGILLVGRKDYSDESGRKSMEELLKDVSVKTGRSLEELYENVIVVADHEPKEYAQDKAAGCDIVISGHTHDGQIWPLGLFSTLFKMNDLTYGMKQDEALTQIVTSGLGTWAFPVRTAGRCEYVVINIGE